MKYQFCQIQDHEQEEQMYICNQLQCINLKDNKLLCQKCLCYHNGLNYNNLKEKATNNYNEYMQILKSEIKDSEELIKNVDDQIIQIKQVISKTLDHLQKQIVQFVDNQRIILNINQNTAQQEMQQNNPSLDLLIYFGLFSNTKLVNKLSQKKQQMKKFINDIIENIKEEIIEYFDKPDINQYLILENEQKSFQIESIFQQKLPYGYCSEHFTQKSSICTHKECLSQNNADYYCLRCCKTTHIEHFQQDYIEEYDKLKQIQKTKQTLYENEIKKVKESAQKLIDDQIRKVKSDQKEQYQKYKVTIKNIKQLEQQFQIRLSVQNSKYIFGDLLLSLITMEDEEIKSQLNHEYERLEELLKNCKIQDELQFKEKCNLILSYSNIIFKLKKDNEKLQQKIEELKKIISCDNILAQIELINVCIGELEQTTHRTLENLTFNTNDMQNTQEEHTPQPEFMNQYQGELEENQTNDNFNLETNWIKQQKQTHQQKTELIVSMLTNITEICMANNNRRNGWRESCQIS